MNSSASPSAAPGAAAYPPIDDYALIGDCHSSALVSRAGAIDWCCMPRLDHDSVFGRMLDWERGGSYRLAPTAADARAERRYLDETMVLETVWHAPGGCARVLDLFTMRQGGREHPYEELVRVVEVLEGEIELALAIEPRFDMGTTTPWIRAHADGVFSAIGGHSGLLLSTDWRLECEQHALRGRGRWPAGTRRRLSMHFALPERLYPDQPSAVGMREIDRRVARTIAWWRQWASQARFDRRRYPRVLRSALTIKTLTNSTTGAIAAAATTSLPEAIGGERNWDYRHSWVRDSSFALRALLALGFDKEAHGFRQFIERTVAGDSGELQVLYGLGGEHRLPEVTIDRLQGYRGSRPVRVGNAAHEQMQSDIYGELLDLSWVAALSGAPPDPNYWRLLVDVVETAARVWRHPDHGIWEMRAAPRHFVHSKVMCWAALDRGLRLAERWGLLAPPSWRATRDAIRHQVLTRGYDQSRGIFVQAFGGDALDAALLLLPRVEFVAYDDPRMQRTVEAIRRDLTEDGWLVRRYVSDDGLPGAEGAFLACTFWLCECLAKQGRADEARAVFARAEALASDLGLFAEQVDARQRVALGNYPQGLSHYSHISAAVALGCGGPAAAAEADPGSG
ncbi:MAG: glycoside hydrolase family 15 protein [Deltaproteobacteria bacterium]|nr:glycoside hydrolase family 15 protein [Deltaproteobacteria bacterium]